MKRGVADRDADVASALVNTSQQNGGALGTALLNAIAATATVSYLITYHGAVQAGLVHGYQPLQKEIQCYSTSNPFTSPSLTPT